jgi:acetyl-CoA carboxylase beta subunit
MPYSNCPNCDLTIYSAAIYSTVERCPRCDAQARRISPRAAREEIWQRIEAEFSTARRPRLAEQAA